MMNSANPSPADQMDGVDTCRICGAHFTQDDDEVRCPTCGRWLSPEATITYDQQQACPWGGPLHRNSIAEAHGKTWIITRNDQIDDDEEPADRWEASVLDRLLGYLTRMGMI